MARATEEDFEFNCLVYFHLLVEELYQSCGLEASVCSVFVIRTDLEFDLECDFFWILTTCTNILPY